MKNVNEMTDIEFVKHYIKECYAFISPLLFYELRKRNLIPYVNYISGTIEERIAQAMANMSQAGHYIGEPEIEEIAGHIDHIKFLKNSIAKCEPTNFIELGKLVDDMKNHIEFVRNYFL